MIVVVDAAFFASPAARSLEFLALLELCFAGQHILLTDPIYQPGASPEIDAWLAELSRPLRMDVSLVLDDGPQAAAQKSPTAARIRLGNADNVRVRVPSLTLSSALRLLRAPLQLLVENRFSDGAFLRRMALPDWQRPLQDAFSRRFIEMEHGGGIESLLRRIEEAAAHPLEHMRLWVMFDSDARDRGQTVVDISPSEVSNRVAQTCAAVTQPWPLTAHRLDRRAIENYVPVQALFAWAETYGGPRRAALRRCAEAYSALTPQQKHCYNVKAGLWGDLSVEQQRRYRDPKRATLQDADLAPVFRGLDREARRDLKDGFGRDVASLFRGAPAPHIEEEWLRREVTDAERLRWIQTIFDRM